MQPQERIGRRKAAAAGAKNIPPEIHPLSRRQLPLREAAVGTALESDAGVCGRGQRGQMPTPADQSPLPEKDVVQVEIGGVISGAEEQGVIPLSGQP